MKAKHIVEVVKGFTNEMVLGALVVGDREVAPSQVRKTEYVAGQRIQFDTKAHATGFAKHHGDKVKYIGKE